MRPNLAIIANTYGYAIARIMYTGSIFGIQYIDAVIITR